MDSVCLCERPITRSFVVQHKNVCPTCNETLTVETSIDNLGVETLYDDPPKISRIRSNPEWINKEQIHNRNSDQDSDEDDEVQNKRTSREREIGSETIFENLGKIIAGADRTNRLLSQKHKAVLPKFPSLDTSVNMFFVRLRYYMEVKNLQVDDSESLRNILIDCFQGEALELFCSLEADVQVDLSALRDILIRHFEPRKHEDIHTESLMTARKREDETVSQYFLRLKKLASTLDIKDNMLLYAFKRGLPTTYRKHVATKSVTTLQELFNEATAYERIASFGPTPEET